MPDTKIDIVVTWPKTKPLQYYLDGLMQAVRHGEQINYRVARLPRWTEWPDVGRRARCYRVHDGAVRGYTEIVATTVRKEGEVMGQDGRYWPAGNYVVCSPIWYPLSAPVLMKGFQGWRWLEWEINP